MDPRRGIGTALFGAGLVVLSCSSERSSAPEGTAPDATARVAELRARFPRVLALAGSDGKRHVSRRANVVLPSRAGREVVLEDATSRLSVRFALQHVQDARIEAADGFSIYRGALDGADILHRVHPEGTEDFVAFERPPSREQLEYVVDVSRVAGLRLVSNTLEFLDEGGTPVLRVAPPYVVDSLGERHEASLAVKGCDYDTSPAGLGWLTFAGCSLEAVWL